MTRNREITARMELTKNRLKQLLTEFGIIRSLEDIRKIFDTHPDVSLHLISPDLISLQPLIGYTPKFLMIIQGSPAPIGKPPTIRVLHQALERYVPKGPKRGQIVRTQMALAALSKEKALPKGLELLTFRAIGTSSDFIYSQVGTDFFESCMYAENIYTPDDSLLGTLVITEIYPMIGYTDTEYKKDRFFLSPTREELRIFTENNAPKSILINIMRFLNVI